eukprot:gb/GFBE01011698.1/.p1 GENE.gb/GFBE01011698.1/~~gb/GFBE01011698.1/.p1  ORF type:complete len:744 (+),score=142.36 gb/GFBE01011698.1/:1-2232(+)
MSGQPEEIEVVASSDEEVREEAASELLAELVSPDRRQVPDDDGDGQAASSQAAPEQRKRGRPPRPRIKRKKLAHQFNRMSRAQSKELDQGAEHVVHKPEQCRLEEKDRELQLELCLLLLSGRSEPDTTERLKKRPKTSDNGDFLDSDEEHDTCACCGMVHRWQTSFAENMFRDLDEESGHVIIKLRDLAYVSAQKHWDSASECDEAKFSSIFLLLVVNLLKQPIRTSYQRRTRTRELADAVCILDAQFGSWGIGPEGAELRTRCSEDLLKIAVEKHVESLRGGKKFLQKALPRLRQMGPANAAATLLREYPGFCPLRRNMLARFFEMHFKALCSSGKREQALKMLAQLPWDRILQSKQLLVLLLKARHSPHWKEQVRVLHSLNVLSIQGVALPTETLLHDLPRYAGESWMTLKILVKQVVVSPLNLELRASCVLRLREAWYRLPRLCWRPQMTSKQKQKEQVFRGRADFLVTSLNELIPDLFKQPSPEPEEGPLTQLLKLMPRRVACTVGKRTVTTIVKKVFPSGPLACKAKSLPRLGSTLERALLTTQAELESLANLLELYPSDITLWRMTAAALLDVGSVKDPDPKHSTMPAVHHVWSPRASFWADRFFAVPLPGHLHGMPAVVYQTLVLIAAFTPNGARVLLELLEAMQDARRERPQYHRQECISWPQRLAEEVERITPLRDLPYETWQHATLHAMRLQLHESRNDKQYPEEDFGDLISRTAAKYAEMFDPSVQDTQPAS